MTPQTRLDFQETAQRVSQSHDTKRKKETKLDKKEESNLTRKHELDKKLRKIRFTLQLVHIFIHLIWKEVKNIYAGKQIGFDIYFSVISINGQLFFLDYFFTILETFQFWKETKEKEKLQENYTEISCGR